MQCTQCNGHGEVKKEIKQWKRSVQSHSFYIWITCNICNGSGEIKK